VLQDATNNFDESLVISADGFETVHHNALLDDTVVVVVGHTGVRRTGECTLRPAPPPPGLPHRLLRQDWRDGPAHGTQHVELGAAAGGLHQHGHGPALPAVDD
jgi:hypothetical protein